MKTEKKIFIILAVSLAVVFFPSFLLAVQAVVSKPLTVHTGLSLHYAMAGALNIPQTDWMSVFVLRKESLDIRNLYLKYFR